MKMNKLSKIFGIGALSLASIVNGCNQAQTRQIEGIVKSEWRSEGGYNVSLENYSLKPSYFTDEKNNFPCFDAGNYHINTICKNSGSNKKL
jgi:hypothetical protein